MKPASRAELERRLERIIADWVARQGKVIHREGAFGAPQAIVTCSCGCSHSAIDLAGLAEHIIEELEPVMRRA